MILKTSNGDKEYSVKELNFVNVMCDLEDNGIDVMALLDDEKRESMKVFTTMRAIISVITGVKDKDEAGKIFVEHLKNGGQITEIMNAFTEVMQEAGFGTSAAEEEPQKKTKTKAAE